MRLYANWAALTAAINDPNGNRRFMGELAALDLNTPFGQHIAQHFPEYFSTEDEGGAIPLSVVRRVAEQKGREAGAKGDPADFPESYGATDELHIPLVEYAIEGCDDGSGWSIAKDENVAPMPDELRSATKQGDKASIGGRELVLVEYNNNSGVGIAYFAPAERVDPTC